MACLTSRFQSTPSAWRVTQSRRPPLICASFQSTPSAWRVTASGESFASIADISIHTLRMEGDAGIGRFYSSVHKFQSTPSAWRVTLRPHHSYGQDRQFQSTPSAWRVTISAILVIVFAVISIHTLRMEGDAKSLQVSPWQRSFQSTPSAWRVTMAG